jgi:pimeloyl-ACP methyl ester carboxylesterase
VGGQGPAVILLHGFGTTGDMWVPLASVLAADHTVIVPDLRGLGFSSKPSGGYDKKKQSHDVAGVMDALGVSCADFVTHDIGNMVGYALAIGFPDRVTRFVLIDAPLPGSRALGADRSRPPDVAVWLWRPRHGAPCRWP